MPCTRLAVSAALQRSRNGVGSRVHDVTDSAAGSVAVHLIEAPMNPQQDAARVDAPRQRPKINLCRIGFDHSGERHRGVRPRQGRIVVVRGPAVQFSGRDRDVDGVRVRDPALRPEQEQAVETRAPERRMARRIGREVGGERGGRILRVRQAIGTGYYGASCQGGSVVWGRAEQGVRRVLRRRHVGVVHPD